MNREHKVGLALTIFALSCLLLFSPLIHIYNYNYTINESVQSNANIGGEQPNVKYSVVKASGERSPWFTVHNVITNVGMNWTQYNSHGTATPNDNLTYIALSTNTTAPADTWTDCYDEITTNNLSRVTGSITYDASITGGDAIVYVYYNFSATGSSTVGMACLMTDGSDGAPDVPWAIALLSPAATMASGDTLDLQWNVTRTS